MKKRTDAGHISQTIPEALARYENSEKTALICADEALSYRELLSDARHIAHALIERGVKKGDRVVLDLGRSANYLRVFLGVILAGAVQVTIHNGWPENQRKQVYSDCTPVLTIDDAMAAQLRIAPLTAEKTSCALPALTGSDPFQIVYTSGSTGRPKGVVNCHLMPLINFMEMKETGEEGHALKFFQANCECMLSDANLAFGAATGQIFLPLLNGKTIALATDEELTAPERLAKCIRLSEADSLMGIASRFYQYMQEPSYYDAIAAMRMFILCGELVAPKVLETFQALTGVWVSCAYASTEAGMCMFSARCRTGQETLYTPPVNRNPVYVLSQGSTSEAAAGETGELCIGGPIVRWGSYWNDAELTGEKFIDHPVYGTLFRSGDGAQRLADGRLRLTGRLDGTMTKLRGLRIDLGAIESAMESFPGVQCAFAKVQGDGPEAVLCGYYTGAVDQGALRRTLADALPYYMVPALMLELAALPLNANGKVNRNALPPIERLKKNYCVPTTREERLLCEAFAQALQTKEPVGIEDSFFELGGDSIRGMVIGTILREQGYELRMEWLFSAPTVRELALMMMPIQQEEAGETGWFAQLTDAEWDIIEKAVGRENVEAVYPVLFHGREYLRRGSLWMIPLIRILDRRLTGDEIRGRLSELQRCHCALRSVFIGSGTDRPFQVVLTKGAFSFFETDLRALSSGEDGRLSPQQESYLRTLLTLNRQKEPSDSCEVPFRLGLIQVGENTTVVFIYCSHLLLDMSGLMQVLNELLGQESIRPDGVLFGRYLRRLLVRNRAPAVEHWNRVTESTGGFSRLPGGDGQQTDLIHDEAVSDPNLMRRAYAFCAVHRITMSTLLHYAAGETLMDLLGLPQVCFASTTSGRDSSSARLAGMFINHFPVLIRRGDTLEAVQEQVFSGLRSGYLDTEDLPPALSLPGMTGVFRLNVETAAIRSGDDPLPGLMRGDRRFAIAESAACAPPSGINGELTLMVFLERQLRLDFYYAPAFIDRGFVKRFAAALLTKLRMMLSDDTSPI